MVPTPNTTNSGDQIDILLVPLLGFNKKLYRIGYGAGYYDRTIQLFKNNK